MDIKRLNRHTSSNTAKPVLEESFRRFFSKSLNQPASSLIPTGIVKLRGFFVIFVSRQRNPLITPVFVVEAKNGLPALKIHISQRTAIPLGFPVNRRVPAVLQYRMPSHNITGVLITPRSSYITIHLPSSSLKIEYEPGKTTHIIAKA